MQYRELGKTDLRVSAVGLGTEYLNHRPRSTVVSVVREAIEAGVNYFDIVFAFREYRDNLGAAFSGLRNRAVIAGHIGCAETDGHYRLSRDGRENDKLFHDLLKRLGTDCVDVLMIQMVNRQESVDAILRPRGLMELAQRLRKAGKARYVGVSGHTVPAMVRLLALCPVDVVMFPVNIAWGMAPGRTGIFKACRKHGAGLVAMKVFGGGRVFAARGGVKITPVQCLSYALAQPGVSCAVPGVRSAGQLKSALRYAEASPKEKAYKSIAAAFQEDLQGNCVYCNHCQPCPVGIDIGATLRRLDRMLLQDDRRRVMELNQRVNYYYPGRLRVAQGRPTVGSGDALRCTKCGVCVKRCPFGVDVVARMRQAAAERHGQPFGKSS